MSNLINFEIGKLIIIVFAGVVYPFLKMISDIKSNHQSKFSLESVVDAIFYIDSDYAYLINKLNSHPYVKFIIYEASILFLLPILYYKIISDAVDIMSLLLGAIIAIVALWYINVSVKSLIRKRRKITSTTDMILNRLRRNYILNRIVSHYFVIWGIYVTFYVINYNREITFYSSTFTYLFFELIFPILVIWIIILVIDYSLLLANKSNKIDYINETFWAKSDITIRLILKSTSYIRITGQLLGINLKNLRVDNKGFKSIIDYGKIEFVEAKIIEKD